jgi:hypothetical protein
MRILARFIITVSHNLEDFVTRMTTSKELSGQVLDLYANLCGDLTKSLKDVSGSLLFFFLLCHFSVQQSPQPACGVRTVLYLLKANIPKFSFIQNPMIS